MNENLLFNPSLLSINQILRVIDSKIRHDRKIWPSLSLELVRVLASHNIEVEHNEPREAIEKAQNIIIVISYHLGGRSIYLPGGNNLTQAINDIFMAHIHPDRNYPEMVFSADINNSKQAWHGVLIQLIDILIKYYENHEGLEPYEAMKKAKSVIMLIAKFRGGRSLYMPGIDKLKLAIRDQAILQAFNGQNHIELSLKTNLTTTQIYNIIKKRQAQGRQIPAGSSVAKPKAGLAEKDHLP